MQTFLPYPSFVATARTLDRQRLGKQRVEVLQLLRTGEDGGWSRHPARLMWRGHEWNLAWYGVCICREWRQRGYLDNCVSEIVDIMMTLEPTREPSWLGDDRLHSSHRSALLRKMPEHYGKFGWTDTVSEYWWSRCGCLLCMERDNGA